MLLNTDIKRAVIFLLLVLLSTFSELELVGCMVFHTHIQTYSFNIFATQLGSFYSVDNELKCKTLDCVLYCDVNLRYYGQGKER